MNWTNEQTKAISLKNGQILVSAAAGSGKTAVMVERIIRLITEEPYVDIDKLLVVTFTRKAADSMRDKIRRALERLLRENPENEHLQRQLLLINHAHISTIDSFCNFIVKNYFYLLDDVSSNYRIAQNEELSLLETDVLNSLLESEYKRNDPDFIYFVDYFANKKNDIPLEKLINSLYKYSQSHENPTGWLNACVANYENASSTYTYNSTLINGIIENYIKNAIELTEKILAIVEKPEGPSIYYNSIMNDLENLRKILLEDDLVMRISYIESLEFKRLSSKKNPDESDELREKCKNERNNVKASIIELKKLICFDNPEIVIEEMMSCIKPIKELVRLTIKFGEELFLQKKKKNLYGHNDIAHMALEILSDDGVDISHAKKQLGDLFFEIFIDEYQDSNRLQEKILYSVAKKINDKKRVFMVGDVKQSIYKFRMACPEMFIEKLYRFTDEESSCQRVILSNNFRSRKQLVDFVNSVFEKLMIKDIGGFDYDNNQKLVYSADFYPVKSDEYRPELLHYCKMDENQNTYEAEAYMIGARIHELINGSKPLMVKDEASGKLRTLKYSDISILLRSKKDVAGIIKKVLEEEFSIPVVSNTATSFFDSFEISLVLNYLKILDNPYVDYPLAMILLSPLGNFNPEELSEIRLINNEVRLFENLKSAVNSKSLNDYVKNKVLVFMDKYEALRLKLPYSSVHEIIWELYEQYGIEAFVSALPVSEHRLGNLNKLLNYAIEFENNNSRSLFDFLRYVEKIIKLDLDINEQSEGENNENAVKIMTMHKSKGLEFPVVFLAGLTKSFNKQDEKSTVLLHPELGIGMEYVDVNNRTKRNTLLKRLISKKMNVESIAEEIRILYVAMTRAKEKLIISCCHTEKEKLNEESFSFGYFNILKGLKYWDWLKDILPNGKNDLEIREFFQEDFASVHMRNKVQRQLKDSSSNSSISRNFNMSEEELKKRLDFVYKSQLKEIFKKLSVTVIKEKYNYILEEAWQDEQLIDEEIEYPVIPRFINEEKGISGAKKGLLYHSLFEHWDYRLDNDVKSIKDFLSLLLNNKIITEKEYAVVDPRKLLRFINSDIGQRMKVAYKKGKLKREQAFSVILRRNEGFEFLDSDILLQGIIDAYFEEGDSLVLLDYKTDYLPDNNPNSLADKYSMQLKCYKYALEKITQKTVSELWIYSVYADSLVSIKL